MTGHRRGTGKPLGPVARARRRLELTHARIAAAPTALAALGPALDSVRVELAAMDPERAERHAGALVSALVSAGRLVADENQKGVAA